MARLLKEQPHIGHHTKYDEITEKLDELVRKVRESEGPVSFRKNLRALRDYVNSFYAS